MKKVFLVSHYTPTQGIIDKFKVYFYSKEGYKTYLIQHPLYPSSELPSLVRTKSRVVKVKLPSIIQYFIEGITSFFLLKKVDKNPRGVDLAICFDPLAFFHTFTLKKLLNIKTVVYYNLDFSRNRFKNKFMNPVYRLIDRLAYNKSDFFISVTKEYIEYTDPDKKNKDKNILIDHFVETKLINRGAKKKKNSIVFAGTFGHTINFTPLLKALKKLKQEDVSFIFDLYGTGIHEAELKEEVKNLGLSDVVSFKGVVKNKKLVREILPKYEIGVAPYIAKKEEKGMDHMFQGNDLTSKLVEYIAAGLPLVTVRLYPAFDVIEEKEFGFLVSKKEDWYDSLKKLIKDKNLLNRYSNNAEAYSERYDTEKVVTPILKKILSE